MTSKWVADSTRPIPQEVHQLIRDAHQLLKGTLPGRVWLKVNLGVSDRQARNLVYLFKNKDPRLVHIINEVPEEDLPVEEPDEGNVINREYKPTSEDLNKPIVTFEQFCGAVDVDLDVWSCEKWQPATHSVPVKTKDKNGVEAVTVHRMWGHKAVFHKRPIALSDIPKWEPMDLPMGIPEATEKDVETILLIPDTQVGYRWTTKHDVLVPVHDRRAMSLYLQLANIVKPDRVVLLGDMLDLAAWSLKFPRSPSLLETTTQSLRAMGQYLRQLRTTVGPDVPIDYVEGNHEVRIIKAMVDRMPEAARLRAMDSDRPLLSMENLLGLDKAGIRYVGPYGASMWVPGLEDALCVLHGVRVRTAPGATSAAVINDIRHSAVFGHVHRVEQVHTTFDTPQGQVLVSAGSPGCGCRIDGTVPGHPGKPNWQQGVGLIYVDRKAQATHLDMRVIRDGRLPYDGKVLVGNDYAELEALWTGYEQVAKGLSTPQKGLTFD